MKITDRISSLLNDLSAHPADVDLSAIAALLSEIRETIGQTLDQGTAEKGLSQPGAAANDETRKNAEKISALEKDLAQYTGLFEDLKEKLAGKIQIIYKDSPLKSDILAELNAPSLSIAGFLKMQSQIEYQFNTAWFPERPVTQLSKNQVINPENHKSGGIPWHHA